MTIIEFSDKVRHKSIDEYNAFIMTVTNVEDDKVLCDYFDSKEKNIKELWFDRADLELVEKSKGGFF